MKVAAVLGILVVLTVGLLLAAPQSVGKGSRVVITSIAVEWNGASYTLITTPYDSGSAPSGQQDGVNLYIGFSNSGQGFAPNSTFTLNLLTPGFTVSWTEYCISAQGWQGQPVTGYRYPGVTDYYTSSAPIISPGCVENEYDYSTVPLDSTPPGSLIELVISIDFPNAAYSGPVAFRLV